jgi:hypothetical protein
LLRIGALHSVEVVHDPSPALGRNIGSGQVARGSGDE